MEGNKDDAVKCFKIGKEAIDSGDRARAVKFLNKARRLDPSLPIDDLLLKIDNDSADGPSPTSAGTDDVGNSSKKPDQPSVRHRGKPSGVSATPASSSASSSSPVYTEEQISIVRGIKKKKDYYEMLGLERTCSVEDIRKSYRKLSLKVHPDKNHAPGAEEAFKSVSKAFQCLSNEENRRKYDVTGSEEPVYEQRRTRRHAGQGNNGFYDTDFDADEIFRNFFFGGGMSPANTQFRTFNFGGGMGQRTAAANHASEGFNLRNLIQLLPVLLIILLSMFPSSEPIYALSRSHPYEYKFTTAKGVNFYVRSSKFEQDYRPGTAERVNLERQVERDYVSVLAQNCRHEIQRKQWGFIKETPHCDMLQQFQSAA